jgi:hypothetical protein
MSTNMELIEAKTLGSNTSGVTFSSIPQTYTDLKLVYSARNTTSAAGEGYDATISFNGTTANRVTRVLRGDGSGVAVNTISDPTDFRLLRSIQPSDYTSSIFSNVEIYLPNYTSSDYKLFSVDTVLENNATATGMGFIAGQWSDTAAITSITLGGTGGNLLSGSTFYLYGISNVTSTTKATGGIVSSDGTYNYHMFPFSGTFTPTANITADYLVIAGGGGTGSDNGSGGGAGGVRSATANLTAETSYAVTVGAGGNGGAAPSNNGSKGNNSSFNSLSATGGGLGAGGNLAPSSQTGGSGGGATGNYTGANTTPAYTGGAGNEGSYSPVEGYAGGNSHNTTAVGFSRFSGGGGGAGGAGGNAGAYFAGNGGVGTSAYSDWGLATTTGENVGGTVYYGGGGGGSAYDNTRSPGTAGFGGGGQGSSVFGSGPFNGTANTGGGAGGGGGSSSVAGGAGGSGIVIIRYAI